MGISLVVSQSFPWQFFTNGYQIFQGYKTMSMRKKTASGDTRRKDEAKLFRDHIELLRKQPRITNVKLKPLQSNDLSVEATQLQSSKGVSKKSIPLHSQKQTNAPKYPDKALKVPQSGVHIVAQSPKKLAVVSSIGTLAPVLMSKRKAPVPPVSTVPPKPLPNQGFSQPDPSKVSVDSYYVSETSKSEGVSHTTMQDMYTQRVKLQYYQHSSATPITPLPFTPEGGQTGYTSDTLSDRVVSVSDSSLASGSEGDSLAQELQHFGSSETPNLNQKSLKSASYVVDRPQKASEVVFQHSRPASALSGSPLKQLYQSSEQVTKSSSLKLEIDLLPLQKLSQQEDEEYGGSRDPSPVKQVLIGDEIGSSASTIALKTPHNDCISDSTTRQSTPSLPGGSSRQSTPSFPGGSTRQSTPSLPGGSSRQSTPSLPGGSSRQSTSSLPGGSSRQSTSSLPGGSSRQSTSSLPGGSSRQSTPSLPGGSSRQSTSSLPGGSSRQSTPSLPGGSSRQSTSSLPGGTTRQSTPSLPEGSSRQSTPSLPGGSSRQSTPSLPGGSSRQSTPSLPGGSSRQSTPSLPGGSSRQSTSSLPGGSSRQSTPSLPGGSIMQLTHSSHWENRPNLDSSHKQLQLFDFTSSKNKMDKSSDGISVADTLEQLSETDSTLSAKSSPFNQNTSNMLDTFENRSYGSLQQLHNKPNSRKDSLRPDSQMDSLRPDSQMDSLRPDSQMESLRPDSQMDSLRPDSQMESLRPDSQMDSLRPDSQMDSLRPDSQMDSLRPDSQMDSLRPDSQMDSLRPDSQMDSLRPDSQMDSLRPDSQMDSLRPDSQMDSLRPDSQMDFSSSDSVKLVHYEDQFSLQSKDTEGSAINIKGDTTRVSSPFHSNPLKGCDHQMGPSDSVSSAPKSTLSTQGELDKSDSELNVQSGSKGPVQTSLGSTLLSPGNTLRGRQSSLVNIQSLFDQIEYITSLVTVRSQSMFVANYKEHDKRSGASSAADIHTTEVTADTTKPYVSVGSSASLSEPTLQEDKDVSTLYADMKDPLTSSGLMHELDKRADPGDQLAGGSGQLAGGSGQLAGGSGQLVGGSGQLVGGSGQLAGGSGQLAGGSGQLAGGSGQLAGGSGQLAGGSDLLHNITTGDFETIDLIEATADLNDAGAHHVSTGQEQSGADILSLRNISSVPVAGAVVNKDQADQVWVNTAKVTEDVRRTVDTDDILNKTGPFSRESLAEYLARTSGPVTLEDIVSVHGSAAVIPKVQSKEHAKETDRSSIRQTTHHEVADERRTVHHFCSVSKIPQLPVKLQIYSVKSHTQSHKEIADFENTMDDNSVLVQPPSTPFLSKPPFLSRLDQYLAAIKAPEKMYPAKSVDVFKSSQKRAIKKTEHLPKNEMEHNTDDIRVQGKGIQKEWNSINLIWHPAPPKFSLYPSTIRNHLFPDYQRYPGAKPSQPRKEKSDNLQSRMRSIEHAFKSTSDLPSLTQKQFDSEVESKEEHLENSCTTTATVLEDSKSPFVEEDFSGEGKFDDGPTIRLEEEEEPDMALQVNTSGEEPLNQGMLPFPSSRNLQSIGSTPLLLAESGSSEILKEDLATVLQEIANQKKSFQDLYSSEHSTYQEDNSDFNSSLNLSRGSRGLSLSQSGSRQLLRRPGGRPGASKKRSTKRRTRSAELRVAMARRKLSRKPIHLERSTSFPMLCGEEAQWQDEEEVRTKEQQLITRMKRRQSTPDQIMFAEFMEQQGVDAQTTDPYSWASMKWEEWFDEVYREYRAVWEAYKREKAGLYHLSDTDPLAALKSRKQEVVSTVEEKTAEEENFPELKDIDMIMTDETLRTLKTVQKEVINLDEMLQREPYSGATALHLCRRGALLRKLGRLREAKSDLDKGIELQPNFADAYWHRHLLFTIQGNEKAALQDLSTVLEFNKHHLFALQMMATRHYKLGDFDAALKLVNVALQCSPNDSQLYMFRATLLEKKGSMDAAIVDYARAAELDEKDTEGLMKQGMHYFRSRSYKRAGMVFGKVLERDPSNTTARIHQAKVAKATNDYSGALKEISATIHLSPNNAEAFFIRGCILRKVCPKQSLMDLSVSLLLDDSRRNVYAYLHRGILYTEIKRFEDALSDFGDVVQLVPNLAAGHVNIGLIYLKHYKNVQKAMDSFTKALKANPTYARAYYCRMEVLKMIREYQLAIRDLTAVIHMRPDEPLSYLKKGHLHLLLSEYSHAEECIRIASTMSGTQGTLPIRDAAVAAFLGNKDLAVSILKKELRSHPYPYTHLLLGKLYQKEGNHTEASEAFHAALTALTIPRYAEGVNKPIFRSECHTCCGHSLLMLGEESKALTIFAKAIKCNPKNAQAYYYQSLCKKKLCGAQPALHDINKSLKLDPSKFEVFLSCACMYDELGQPHKAIFNCTKAIHLQPKSARTHLYRGCIRMKMGLLTEALEDLDEAVALCNNSTTIYYNRALCHQKMRHFKEAELDYDLAVRRAKEVPLQIFINRGLLYLEIENYEDALKDFNAAVEISSINASLFQAIGICHQRLCNLEESVSAYSEAISLSPTFWEAHIGRGNVHFEQMTVQGMQESKRNYSRVLMMDPFNLPARLNLAYILQMEGKLRQAWEHLSLLLLIYPTDHGILESRAVVSLQAGYLQGSLKDVNDAIKISKTAKVLTNRGVIHEYLDDKMNAAKDFQEAISLDPDYHIAHFNLGNLYFHHRQFTQASKCYSKVLDLSPDDDSALVNIAICKVIEGDTEGALVDLNNAVLVNPHLVHVYFNRANIYKAFGMYDNAEDDYQQALSIQPEHNLSQYGLEDIKQLKTFLLEL